MNLSSAIALMAFFVLSVQQSSAQFNLNLKDKVKNKVEDRINNGVDRALDKGLDETEEGIKEGVKGQKTPAETNKSAESATQNEDDNADIESPSEQASSGIKTTNPPLESYSKFDFIPGEKVIAFEDFSQDAVGDFPARWNTNGSGEVVTLSKFQGKWLKVDNASGVSFIPDDFNNLPENFTLEFDLVYNNWNNEYAYARRVMASFFNAAKTSESMGEYAAGPGFGFTFDGGMGDGSIFISNFNENGNYGEIRNEKSFPSINPENNGKVFHIAIWRQKTRVRVYIDEQKVYDLPRLMDASLVLNAFRLHVDISDENKPLFFSNFKLAVGAPDTRNKLVSEGKFSTTGILFDVNSDILKGESYGVLKEIAAVLSENPTINVKIIGHTDSDGDASKNLDLSKRRASAVKNALINTFGISASRLTTDGKGASEPVSPNTTSEGKASNRRVEFIKM